MTVKLNRRDVLKWLGIGGAAAAGGAAGARAVIETPAALALPAVTGEEKDLIDIEAYRATEDLRARAKVHTTPGMRFHESDVGFKRVDAIEVRRAVDEALQDNIDKGFLDKDFEEHFRLTTPDDAEDDFIDHLMKNEDMPGDVESPLYVSLHTSDPRETRTPQYTGGGYSGYSLDRHRHSLEHEAAYPMYARVRINRTPEDWSVVGGRVTNLKPIEFPQCTGGHEMLTHVAVSIAPPGIGWCPLPPKVTRLTAPVAISMGVSPGFGPGALSFEIDD